MTLSDAELDVVADLLPDTYEGVVVPLTLSDLIGMSRAGLETLASFHAEAAEQAARRADAYAMLVRRLRFWITEGDQSLAPALSRARAARSLLSPYVLATLDAAEAIVTEFPDLVETT